MGISLGLLFGIVIGKTMDDKAEKDGKVVFTISRRLSNLKCQKATLVLLIVVLVYKILLVQKNKEFHKLLNRTP
jgi:hypothetical protein